MSKILSNKFTACVFSQFVALFYLNTIVQIFLVFWWNPIYLFPICSMFPEIFVSLKVVFSYIVL